MAAGLGAPRTPRWPFLDRGPASREETIAPQADIRTALPAHLGRLWRYALVLSRARDVADDLVQSTCLRALERADQFQPGTRMDRWLLAILHSTWISEIRARKVRTGYGFVDAADALVVDGTAQIEGRVLLGQVVARVVALPEAQRETVFLAYVEGLTYRETADVLQIPIGTVMSRLAAARAALAEAAGEGSVKVLAAEGRR